MAEQKNTKEKVLLKQLQSKDNKEVAQAVSSIKTHGTINAVEPLIDCWNTINDQKIKDQIQELFASLKISGAQTIIIKTLHNKDYQSIHQPLLNSIWQSGIDYSEQIPDLTIVAVRGNYMEAFECLTIIENLEGPFDETLLMDALLEIKKHKEKVDQTTLPMIEELEKVLQKLNNQL